MSKSEQGADKKGQEADSHGKESEKSKQPGQADHKDTPKEEVKKPSEVNDGNGAGTGQGGVQR